jgi:pimeloyl-ACP methyl ester carboxylesterase
VGLTLHALEWAPPGDAGGTPILCIGGALSTARNAEEFGVAAASGVLGPPRRLISPDRRGMGASSAPEQGYKPAQFTEDNEAIVIAAGLDDLIVFGHSLGVPIAIDFALRHPESVRGLVLGDYPALWPRLTEGWLARALAAFDGTWSRDAVTQLQRESVEIRYWQDLASSSVPVLAITGTSGVLLKPDDADRYREACGSESVITIDGADHSLTVNGDHAPFFAVVRGFLADIDRGARVR